MFTFCENRRFVQWLMCYQKLVGRQKMPSFEMKQFYSTGKFTKMGDLYARLGLFANATQEEIKKAYYELSKEFHPDRNVGQTDQTAKFRSITEAYEILSNESTKSLYDKGKISCDKYNKIYWRRLSAGE